MNERQRQRGGEINEREGKCAVRIPDRDAMKTKRAFCLFFYFFATMARGRTPTFPHLATPMYDHFMSFTISVDRSWARNFSIRLA